MRYVRLSVVSLFVGVAAAQIALAQTGGPPRPVAPPPATAAAPAAAPPARNLTVPAGMVAKSQNNWRGRTLVGAAVWNDNSQRIGTVDDVLITEDGKVDQVVIVVSGFLRANKRVAVPFSQLRFGQSRSGAFPTGYADPDGVPPFPFRSDANANTFGVVLPGATRDTLRGMATFSYAQ